MGYSNAVVLKGPKILWAGADSPRHDGAARSGNELTVERIVCRKSTTQLVFVPLALLATPQRVAVAVNFWSLMSTSVASRLQAHNRAQLKVER
jgi:hypothetical protein